MPSLEVVAMTDDSAPELESDLENGETKDPIDLQTVETHLQTADDHLETLLEATENLEAPGPLRERLTETRTELLAINDEFKLRCPDSSGDGELHQFPPRVTRGTVHTILGP